MKRIASVFVLIVCGVVQIGFSQSYLNAAQHYFETEQYANVVETLSANTSFNNYEAIELLGDAYAHQQLWGEAIAQYAVLVEEKPLVAQYHYKYGGAKAMKAMSGSKWQALPLVFDAKESFLKAASLDAQHIDTRWALVKLYTELPGIFGGSTDKALHYADELEAISRVDGHLAKGFIYEKEANFNLAEQHYKAALNLGQSKTCFSTLADFYLKNGENAAAKAVLQSAFQTLDDTSFLDKIAQIESEMH